MTQVSYPDVVPVSKGPSYSLAQVIEGTGYREALIGEYARLFLGDNRFVVPEELEDNSVDLILSDPPYENNAFYRRFGVKWDFKSGAHEPEIWKKLLRKVKPGGWAAIFSGNRTAWKMAAAMDAAGWVIKDDLIWMHAAGQTKGMKLPGGRALFLRPGHEIVWLAMKPLDGTYEQNLTKWGVAAYRVNDARFNTVESAMGVAPREDNGDMGRFPINMGIQHHPDCVRIGYERVQGARVPSLTSGNPGIFGQGGKAGKLVLEVGDDEFLPVSDCHPECPAMEIYKRYGRKYVSKVPHFFYGPHDLLTYHWQPKPQIRERNVGIAEIEAPEAPHMTMKSVEMGRYLVRLLSNPGGIVVDPYAGTGTFPIAAMLEGRNAVGIERFAAEIDPEFAYFDFMKARVKIADEYGEGWMEKH